MSARSDRYKGYVGAAARRHRAIDEERARRAAGADAGAVPPQGPPPESARKHSPPTPAPADPLLAEEIERLHRQLAASRQVGAHDEAAELEERLAVLTARRDASLRGGAP